MEIGSVREINCYCRKYLAVADPPGAHPTPVDIRDGGLEDRGRPRDLILMASVSAAHVSVSVLVSEVLALSTGSREPASVSRPASRPNLDGLGLGCPCLGLGLGLGLGGPGFVYRVSRTGLGLEAGLET